MKGFIIGILIGILFYGLIGYASEKIIMNPMTYINENIYTTKITTPEGTYRVFAYKKGYAGGITAVKIK